MTFIYLHGLNINGKLSSNKLKELGKLGDVFTLNYNSFVLYEEILENLNEKVMKELMAHPARFSF